MAQPTQPYFQPKPGDPVNSFWGEFIGHVVRVDQQQMVIASNSGERTVGREHIWQQVGPALVLDCELGSVEMH